MPTTQNDDDRTPLVDINDIQIGKQTRNKKTNELEGTTVTPLLQRNLLMRWDVAPFAGIYLVLIALDQAFHGIHSLQRVLSILFPSILLSHLALVLMQQWKVSMACFVGYRRANETSPSSWTHCLIQSSALNGTIDAEITTINTSNGVAVVNFRDTIFRGPTNDPDMDSLWKTTNNANQIFHRLVYPDHFPLNFYKEHKGYTTLPQVKTAQAVYGENLTKIQLPFFLDLLGQQLLAPFFLFQLFCVVLWSMDEYWYYALFTLFALIMFECTVAYNRLKGLERLRGTLKHAFHLSCFRHGLWFMLRTDELLPGDIISLTAKTTEINVPADVLILSGTAVVDEALLTGESIPQLKGPLDTSNIANDEVPNTLEMQDPLHKQSILFGGTNLVSHDNQQVSLSNTPTPPDSGIVCMVLRTAFETAQGSLLRNMAHSSMKSADGIHTKDTFVFVIMLLGCAIVSALSVLEKGWNDETRNRFRLTLHVIIIVTSVVPPELPMELSLAVTNSVADLMRRCNVFCTEPYRIPWAGQVDTCCFDKTGTLTSDEMQLRGVRLFGSSNSLVDPSDGDLPWPTVRVMAGCHALAVRNTRSKQRTHFNEVIGDPLEKAVLSGTGYTLHNSNFVLNEDQKSARPRALLIHHRYAFSSGLKRMTVLLTENSDRTMWAVTKGAPETLKQLLTPASLPSDYDEVAQFHMGLGQRVLAMAYRTLGENVDVKELSRDAVELDLTFCGFLILDCPLKPDSKSVISELRLSGHNVVMITGDALLTAAEIARQVGIMPRDAITYELRAKRHIGINGVGPSDVMSSFQFLPVGSSAKSDDGAIALSPTNLKTLKELAFRSEACFCVSGAVLGQLAQVASSRFECAGENVTLPASVESNVMLQPAAQLVLRDLVPIISVFARHAPRQKEAIVAAFNLGGRHTLMCGDGTNDVGALKRAHVGISIISAPELESKQREATATLAKVKAEQKRDRKAKKDGITKKSKSSLHASAFQESIRQLQEAQEDLEHVELGDASVASPFTSRAMSIRCCKDVLQQGRCTLVTMLQIYKILGVNCLVNALVLTKLHMHGVKQGDRQMTILGVAVALLFLFVTRGKPLPVLSAHRPPSSVLCPQALLSIVAQFAVHFSFIVMATDISSAFVDPYDPSIIPDARFNPNVLNTCTYLLTMLATVNTFAVNYRGRPFMEDLHENTLLLRSIQGCYAVLFICAAEVFPPLNDLFQLSPFPDTNMDKMSDDDWVVTVSQAGGLTNFVRQVGFPTAMCSFMVVDTVLAFASEKIIVRMIEGPTH